MYNLIVYTNSTLNKIVTKIQLANFVVLANFK